MAPTGADLDEDGKEVYGGDVDVEDTLLVEVAPGTTRR